LEQTGLGESLPVVACPSILYSLKEREPLTGIQGHGQRDITVWMEVMRKLIHLLQVVVCKHGTIPRSIDFMGRRPLEVE
jgi:hypothetical protein